MTDEKTLEITTHCSDCYFTEIEDGIQTGCRLNRIDKFIEYDKAEFDEEGIPQAYVVNTMCSAKRSDIWANAHKDPEARIKTETQVPLDWVVLHVGNDEKQLYFSLKEIKKHTIQPRRVMFVVKGSIQFSKFLEDAKNCLSDSIVQITRVIENANTRKCLDIGVKKIDSKGPFYVMIKAGESFNTDLNERLNTAINEELLTPLCITGDCEYHGTIISTQLHKMVGGNKEAEMVYNETKRTLYRVEDKIKAIAIEQDKQQSFIYTWGQI